MGCVFPLNPGGDIGIAALRSQCEQLELALDCADIGLWDWDLVSGRASHSRVNKRMLGFEDGEDLGDTYAQVTAKIHPDDLQEMQRRVAAHLRNDTSSYRAEFRVLRKDGTFAWFESRGLVVERDPRGVPLRMLGVHLDISDRKANERLRRELDLATSRTQAELEAVVQLQTSKLIEAANAAELGNRAKNVLLARVGEDLRSPLEVTLATCARLLDDVSPPLPAPLRESVELISTASRALSERVERLLDVSSIEAGTLEICATPVNLRRLLEERREVMEARAAERGIDLRAVCCSDDVVAFADRARLSQVVHELLANAIRLTERGYVQVRARELDGMVFVEVQDSGPGIEPERQATLFHAFQPVGGQQQRSLQRGLGLGLSVCRAVIEAMSGTIGVTSKPGRGSRFWFTLPLAAKAQRVSATRH